MRFTLSEQATLENGVWTAPAFIASVTYDHDTFDNYIDSELWLRQVQADVQQDATLTAPVGIAIDFDQTFDEAIEGSAPFIFLAVALIVFLVAIVHRSYWSAIMVGTGLGITMLAYNGVAALVGLKMGSLLLAFIVPIAYDQLRRRLLHSRCGSCAGNAGRSRDEREGRLPGRHDRRIPGSPSRRRLVGCCVPLEHHLGHRSDHPVRHRSRHRPISRLFWFSASSLLEHSSGSKAQLAPTRSRVHPGGSTDS